MANVDQFEVDTAVVEQRGGLLSAPSAALSKVRETIDQPGFRRAFPTILASLTAIAAIILYVGMQKPEMTTLYSSVSESEKSRIIDALKNMDVEVQLDPVTGQLLVPTDLYHQARISLAAQGLPEFSGDGFEAMNASQNSRSVEGVKLRQVQGWSWQINNGDKQHSVFTCHLAILKNQYLYGLNSPGMFL